MWSLNLIRGKNICSFKDFEYEINNGLTTLLFGENLDNDSQLSNGSGKSSLLEAISIALTGDSLRKVNTDEIINDAEDNAEITATLSNSYSKTGFIIERKFTRGKAQQIKCYATTGEYQEEIVKSSVNEYNQFILDIIGLTKDDIFSSFILSKTKYKSFLSSSDNDKKDIINRFSNGNLVDEAIEALQAERGPLKLELDEINKNVANYQGRLESLNEQLVNAENDELEKKRTKPVKIAEIKKAITDKREEIRNLKVHIAKLENIGSDIDKAYNKLVEMEESDKSVEEVYRIIENLHLLVVNPIEKANDLKSKISQKNNELDGIKHDLDAQAEELKKRNAELEANKKLLDDMSNDENKHLLEALNNEISELEAKVCELDRTIAVNRKLISEKSTRISDLEKILAGVITCPKCGHDFILNNNDKRSVEDINREFIASKEDVKAYRETIKECEDKADDSLDKIVAVKASRSEINKKIESIQLNINETFKLISNINSCIISLKRKEDDITREISKMSDAVNTLRKDLFDEAFEIVDGYTQDNNSVIKQEKININIAEGAINTYQESLKELEVIDDSNMVVTIKKSIEEWTAKYNEMYNSQMSKMLEISKYDTQENVFVEFKTYLANTKIEALSKITNEFLESIGSDIRIQFSGYTVLKSGKIRDKISISLLRDGVDCGSFNKFSAGEKCRVELASILAMSKLINVNCENGRGLDLLIIDEILDSSDESGLASIFQALNSLNITSLIVSHGNIAESYPYRTIIKKLNGVSTINGKRQ